MPFEIKPASDHTLLVTFGESIAEQHQREVWALTRKLLARPTLFVRNVHPAYNSILIDFDLALVTMQQAAKHVHTLAASLAHEPQLEARRLEIPVCYEEPFGPDLQDVAAHCKLTVDAVIALHTRASYQVCFIGFTPGFGYLRGLAPQLFTPRLPTPRTSVPAGSVAIGGEQTAIYPLSTPGGWRIIGRTPLQMFDAERAEASLLAPGDEVRFIAISREEFDDRGV